MLIAVVNAWVGMYQTVLTTDYPQGEYKTAVDVTCYHPTYEESYIWLLLL